MPQTPAAKNQAKDIASYSLLKTRVEEALFTGRRKIEAAKVETYWTAGKLIHEHILQSKGRANYGEQVIARLAGDLEIGERLLQRTLKFYKAFPKIPSGRTESSSRTLSWSHYRELMTVEDEKTRHAFLERAGKSGWSGDVLAEKIRLETRGGPARGRGEGGEKAGPAAKLIPKHGELYTYRLLEPENVHGAEEGLWLDLGFNNHHYVTRGLKGMKPGQIVESVKAEDGSYSVKAWKRGEEALPRTALPAGADDAVFAHQERMLYTYKAIVERVVDGDTLIVKIDQGFDYRTRHYLRLRGIDCPELNVPEGRKSKAFVEKQLSSSPEIVMASSRDDKYGRYLADVWIPQGKNRKDWIYLNQALLDEELANRV